MKKFIRDTIRKIRVYMRKLNHCGCRYASKNAVGDLLCPLRGRCLYKTPSASKCNEDLGIGPINYTEQCNDRRSALLRYNKTIKNMIAKDYFNEEQFKEKFPNMWRIMRLGIFNGESIEITEDLVHSLPFCDIFESLFTSEYNREFIHMMSYIEDMK